MCDNVSDNASWGLYDSPAKDEGGVQKVMKHHLIEENVFCYLGWPLAYIGVTS